MKHLGAHQDSPTVAGAFLSLDSLGGEAVESAALSPDSVFGADVDVLFSRLSVTYQPDPLNTMPTG